MLVNIKLKSFKFKHTLFYQAKLNSDLLKSCIQKNSLAIFNFLDLAFLRCVFNIIYKRTLCPSIPLQKLIDNT